MAEFFLAQFFYEFAISRSMKPGLSPILLNVLLLGPLACNEDDESSSKDRSELCQKNCERSVNCEDGVEDPETELRLCTKECIEYLDQSEKNDGVPCVKAREDFIDCLVTLVGCGDFDETHPCQKKLEKEMETCPNDSEPEQGED